MALVVQGLVAGPLILCCLYGALCVYCCSCLTRAHAASPRLGIRKVFAMNCLLTAALRVLSFGSIAVIAALGYGHADDDDPSATQQFYEKALVVLFDFPDFSIVSAYVLLFLVWCEAFVQVWRRVRRISLFYSLIAPSALAGAPPLAEHGQFSKRMDARVLDVEHSLVRGSSCFVLFAVCASCK